MGDRRTRRLLDLPDALLVSICERFDSVATIGALGATCHATRALLDAGVPSAWQAVAISSGDLPPTIAHSAPSSDCKALLRAVHHVRILLAPFAPQPVQPASCQRPGWSIQGSRRCPAGAMPMSPPVHLTPRERAWLSSHSRCGGHFLHLEKHVLHVHDEAGRCVHRARAVHAGAPALAARSRLRPPAPPPPAMLSAVRVLRARAEIASRVAVVDVSSGPGAGVMRAVEEWLAPLRRCAAWPAGAGYGGDGRMFTSASDASRGMRATSAGVGGALGVPPEPGCAPSSAANCAALDLTWRSDAALVFVSAHSWPRNVHGAMAHARELVVRCAAVWPPRRVLVAAPSPEAASVIRHALAACIFTMAQVGLPVPHIPAGASHCGMGGGEAPASPTGDCALARECEAGGGIGNARRGPGTWRRAGSSMRTAVTPAHVLGCRCLTCVSDQA